MHVFIRCLLYMAIVAAVLYESKADAIDPYETFPMTTTKLVRIIDDPINRAIASLKVQYIKKEAVPIVVLYGSFSKMPFDGINRRWLFCVDLNNQRYEYALPYESDLKELIQLMIDNEICEMQSVDDPAFDKYSSNCRLRISTPGSNAYIGYNTRTPESEPFWEVVDYIEDNFVAPALQNPVDKWWWEDYQWQ